MLTEQVKFKMKATIQNEGLLVNLYYYPVHASVQAVC